MSRDFRIVRHHGSYPAHFMEEREMLMVPTLAQVDDFVLRAHGDQVDKIGVPYVHHLRAVSRGVASFGTSLAMAGLLHDCLEDTDVTVQDLREFGVPERVIDIVLKVTNTPGQDYDGKLRLIAQDRDATRLKIADNAHNLHPDRMRNLPPEQQTRLRRKYATIPSILWKSISHEDVTTILAAVNPSLLPHLAELA